MAQVGLTPCITECVWGMSLMIVKKQKVVKFSSFLPPQEAWILWILHAQNFRIVGAVCTSVNIGHSV
jgi:hypothetical protein